MKRLALSAAVVMPLAVLAGPALADCSDLTIASMNWQSAELMANLDQFILNEGYGCDAEIVAAGIKDGKIVEMARSLSDGGQQGWFIPRYMLDEHPNLNKISEILAHPELFPAPEDASKGAVFNGPAGWGGTIVTTQLAKAFDIEGHGFTLVDTGSAAGLDGSMAKAYEQKAPWLGFYWAPTSMLGKYDMVPVDFGMANDMAEWKRCTSVADCPDPKPNAFPVDNVFTLIASDFAKDADQGVLDYLKKRSWGNDTVNKMMAWMTDNQATGEEGAREFLRTHEEMWTQWVSPEAAEKIKSAL